LYAIGRNGQCGLEPDKIEENLTRLFNLIIDTIPPPKYEVGKPF